MELAEIGKVGERGVQRLALTAEDREAQFLVASWMKQAGMTVRHDHFGNLIGKKEGEDPELPVVMIGSHIDTVPNAGRFDGTVGVLAGIEVVHALHEANYQHRHSIEVVAFCDEEGTRFGDGLFGSRGMAGLVSPDDLHIKDSDHITRYEALKEFGFNVDPDRIDESVRSANEIKQYFEMHIEQGPVLESQNKSVGIVEAIAGPAWLDITINGQAGHAGTTPMNMRKDPLVAASKVIHQIASMCNAHSSEALVATVGKMVVLPGGRNVIPQSVQFSVDIRDTELVSRDEFIASIEEYVNALCEQKGLTSNIELLIEVDPVKCSTDSIKVLKKESDKLGLDAPVMVSGAGHDAMIMKKLTDIGMIFVRNKDGISHNPAEWADEGDIADGARLLLNTIKNYI